MSSLAARARYAPALLAACLLAGMALGALNVVFCLLIGAVLPFAIRQAIKIVMDRPTLWLAALACGLLGALGMRTAWNAGALGELALTAGVAGGLWALPTRDESPRVSRVPPSTGTEPRRDVEPV